MDHRASGKRLSELPRATPSARPLHTVCRIICAGFGPNLFILLKTSRALSMCGVETGQQPCCVPGYWGRVGYRPCCVLVPWFIECTELSFHIYKLHRRLRSILSKNKMKINGKLILGKQTQFQTSWCSWCHKTKTLILWKFDTLKKHNPEVDGRSCKKTHKSKSKKSALSGQVDSKIWIW